MERYKQITQENINEMVELHRKWLNKDADGRRFDLNGYDLRDICFRNVILTDAKLTDCFFYSGDLDGVCLGGAELQDSDFSSANMKTARLQSAKLQNANLEFATLTTANLEYATLIGANLYGADLSYTKWYLSNLKNADMSEANCLSADLSGAYFENTKLRNVILTNAKLKHRYIQVGLFGEENDMITYNIDRSIVYFKSFTGDYYSFKDWVYMQYDVLDEKAQREFEAVFTFMDNF